MIYLAAFNGLCYALFVGAESGTSPAHLAQQLVTSVIFVQLLRHPFGKSNGRSGDAINKLLRNHVSKGGGR